MNSGNNTFHSLLWFILIGNETKTVLKSQNDKKSEKASERQRKEWNREKLGQKPSLTECMPYIAIIIIYYFMYKMEDSVNEPQKKNSRIFLQFREKFFIFPF